MEHLMEYLTHWRRDTLQNSAVTWWEQGSSAESAHRGWTPPFLLRGVRCGRQESANGKGRQVLVGGMERWHVLDFIVM